MALFGGLANIDGLRLLARAQSPVGSSFVVVRGRVLVAGLAAAAALTQSLKCVLVCLEPGNVGVCVPRSCSSAPPV